MKLWKYSGTLLTATGVIHTIMRYFLEKKLLRKCLTMD